MLQELVREIRLQTRNKRSLDDLLHSVMRLDKVSTKEFVALAESIIGEPSKVLQSDLLK